MFSVSFHVWQGSKLSLSLSLDVGVFHASIQIAYLLERHATEANASTYLPVYVYILVEITRAMMS